MSIDDIFNVESIEAYLGVPALGEYTISKVNSATYYDTSKKYISIQHVLSSSNAEKCNTSEKEYGIYVVVNIGETLQEKFVERLNKKLRNEYLVDFDSSST